MTAPFLALLSFLTCSSAFKSFHPAVKVLASELRALQTEENDDNSPVSSFRRNFLSTLPWIAAIDFGLPKTAKAEWVQFPITKGLSNTYHFMRAGQSLLEEADILATNPLFLTNRENALSPLGIEQAHEACRFMETKGINPSVVKFSLAANAMDTADIIAMDLRVGRNRLVPEYTYMDQRGAGKWDMLPLQTTQEAIWAMDVQDGGIEGLGGQPPPHEDGTPNETIANQVTRLRQLLSLLESSLSGDEILLIFPDATGPAVLSALIAGIPLNKVHEIAYQPGELRLDINYNSVRENWPTVLPVEYDAAIARGKNELNALRNTNPSTILNVREQEYNREQLVVEEEAAKVLAQVESTRVKDSNLKFRESQNDQVQRREILQALEAEKNAKRALRREELSASQGPLDVVSLLVLGLASTMVAWKGNGAKESTFEKKNGQGINKMSAQFSVDNPFMESDLHREQANLASLQPEHSFSELEKLEGLLKAAPIDMHSLLELPNDHTKDKETSEWDHDELERMETNMKNAPIETPDFSNQVSQFKAERLALAQNAMDKYMSSDDGGEAWLGVMLDLASEEDSGTDA